MYIRRHGELLTVFSSVLRKKPRRMRGLTRICLLLSAGASLLMVMPSASPQGVRKQDIGNGRAMLKQIKKDIAKHYYDPQFRGMNLDTHFAEADQKIQQAQSLAQIRFGETRVRVEIDERSRLGSYATSLPRRPLPTWHVC